MGYIYCFTNLINNKKYIGSTIQEVKKRYNQHLYNAYNKKDKIRYSYPLYCAIRKYGIENFSFEILEEYEGEYHELLQLESNYIIKFDSIVPNGYNQTSDTTHPMRDLEIAKKVSETKRENANRVIAMDKNSEEIIGIYRSIADCAEAIGLDEKKIAACCRGERLSTGEKVFYWLDENDDLIIHEYKRDLYKGEKGTTQIQSSSRKVAKINLETGEQMEVYDTIALAARENNCDASGISKVCRGLRNKAKGYGWKYV